jgi:hypothetical protein
MQALWRPRPTRINVPINFLCSLSSASAGSRALKAADDDELSHVLRVAHGISDGDRATLQLALQSEAVHADGIGTQR